MVTLQLAQHHHQNKLQPDLIDLSYSEECQEKEHILFLQLVLKQLMRLRSVLC